MDEMDVVKAVGRESRHGGMLLQAVPGTYTALGDFCMGAVTPRRPPHRPKTTHLQATTGGFTGGLGLMTDGPGSTMSLLCGIY